MSIGPASRPSRYVLVASVLVTALFGCGSSGVQDATSGDAKTFGDGRTVDCQSGPDFTGCPCTLGETKACYTGPAGTRAVGACKAGTQTCVSAGTGELATAAFGPCTGEVLPGAPGDAPARLIAPLSTSRATTNRPTLRWEGTQPVTVTVCRDRACADVIQSFPASGGVATPSTPLPAGVVFWRVESSSAESCTGSETWALKVPPRAASVDTSWGSFTDVNGDGISDLVLLDVQNTFAEKVTTKKTYGPAKLHVFLGSKAGLPALPSSTISIPEELIPFRTDAATIGLGGVRLRSGDVNGDGFADVVAFGQLFLGGPSGLASTPAWSFADPSLPKKLPFSPNPDVRFGLAGQDLGDFDGDGYADLAIAVSPGQECWKGTKAPVAAPQFAGARVYVFAGGRQGLSSTPTKVLDSFGALTPGCIASVDTCMGGNLGSFGGAIVAADMNGDGFADLLTSTLLPGRAQLYLGSPSGLSSAPARTILGPEGDTCQEAGDLAQWMAAGDYDGDGRADALIGKLASLTDTAGRGLLYPGAATGLGDAGKPYAAPTKGVPGGNIMFGGPYGVRSGDVNGDGFADVLVATLPQAGDLTGAQLFLGAAGGLAYAPAAKLVVTGNTKHPSLQTSLNDDFDGDGLDDALITGWVNEGDGTRTFFGAVYSWTGGGLSATPSWKLAPPAGSSAACCLQ